MEHTDKIKELLTKYWKIDNLKEKQTEIIMNYLNGHDVVGLLPTGYGKSLCYLLPPLITDKIMFIISPLISLMEDQKEKLVEMDIPVACLHGNNFNKDKEIFSIIDGNIKIVYMSPEYLIKGDGLELATSLMELNKLGYLAIDESHCISAWGHDFRDDYLKINRFRKHFPNIPIMAVTATATMQVVEDIISNLNMNNPKITVANFDRPNIYLKCIGVKNILLESIESWIEKYDGHKLIIYTNKREQTTELSKDINKKYGNISSYYHAGMSKGMRNKIQTKFNNGTYNIIVSTVAFGMGIDQTVRCVIIFGSPNSIEEYYQMIGRAGRDGDAAESVLLFQYRNIAISTSIAKKSGLDKEIIECKVRGLNKIANYFYFPGCRRRFILEYFGQVPKFFWCNYCDNCSENKMIDLTDKFVEVIFKKKKYIDIFTTKELELLEKNNLIINNGTNGSYYEPLITIKNWKKIIESNKYLEKSIPNKYLIKIKK
uniref:Helicase n=1 Tax=viral metagenome TaxID=1070528 RepID=A0A6C0HVP8_9ZZZZ